MKPRTSCTMMADKVTPGDLLTSDNKFNINQRHTEKHSVFTGKGVFPLKLGLEHSKT